MKKLPIGIQSFTDLRTNGYLYVDKTPVISRMIESGKAFFLSRPRRFGKSLLISTLEAIFKGESVLFEGLYIYDKRDWTHQHPVIRIDWTAIKHTTPEEIEQDMSAFLKSIAQTHGITLSREYASSRFDELITLLHRKTGEKVVVLIDEYDVPVLDAINRPSEEVSEIRQSLYAFYRVLKATDEHLQFVFLTGVSKFAGVSVFSALNNLNDITLNDKYASICGYTQQELETYFPEYIREVAEYTGMNTEDLADNIRTWYNGYSWDGKTTMYNPFSTLMFFENRQFGAYWFRTGTPTFLIHILKKRNRMEPILHSIRVGENIFDIYDPADIGEIPLLFQAGYLTIKQKELIHGVPQYTLAVPNSEVNESLLKHLLNAYTDYPFGKEDDLKNTMLHQIQSYNAEGLARSLRIMLAHVPYELQVKNEAYYHSIFLLWMKLLGFDIQGEVMTNIGRIDAVWHQPGLTVVAEIKYHTTTSLSSLLRSAIAQIRKQRYYEPYMDRKVILLAVAFTGKDVGCRMVSL
ncbi:MAG: ATP-binding protein [Tannerellaceae bacterium]|nr:ATP-binding protein [Tannerellaceae bacterium]